MAFCNTISSSPCLGPLQTLTTCPYTSRPQVTETNILPIPQTTDFPGLSGTWFSERWGLSGNQENQWENQESPGQTGWLPYAPVLVSGAGGESVEQVAALVFILISGIL